MCCGIPLRRSKRLLNSMLVGELSPGKMFFFVKLFCIFSGARGIAAQFEAKRQEI